MNPALRALPEALKNNLLTRGFFIALIVSAISSVALPFALTRFLPSTLPFPFTAIAASFVIDFAGLAYLLAILNEAQAPHDNWRSFCAWLASILAAGAAFGGLALARTHSESLHTFVVLWLL